MKNLDSNEIEEILSLTNSTIGKKHPTSNRSVPTKNNVIKGVFLVIALFSAEAIFAQSPATMTLIQEPGIIITIILLCIPVLAGIIIMIIKLSNLLQQQRNIDKFKEAEDFSIYLNSLSAEKASLALLKRKTSLDYHLTNQELSGVQVANDEKGLVNNINFHTGLPFVATKKKAQKRPDIDPQLSKLICWYIGCAT